MILLCSAARGDISSTTNNAEPTSCRPRKTKIGTEVDHVTRDSDTTFNVKRSRSRSPGRFVHHRVGASGGCSGGRENVLAVGNCCYLAVCSAAQGAKRPRGRRGAGHTVAAARLQLAPLVFYRNFVPKTFFDIEYLSF